MNSAELQEAYAPVRFAVSSGGEIEILSNSYELVRQFMEVFGHPVHNEPVGIDLTDGVEWEKMRLALIQEEFAELLEAAGYPESARWIRDVVLVKDHEADVVECADALGDLEYVINGMALGMGVDLPAVVAEIHRSNMTKLGPDGKPIYREDGKILKGEGYERPNLRGVLGL